MCNYYDDMSVEPLPHVTHCILRNTVPKTQSKSFITNITQYFRRSLKNIRKTFHLWLLLYLVISPAACGPLLQPISSRRSPETYFSKYPNRWDSKVGVGIARNDKKSSSVSYSKRQSLVLTPKESRTHLLNNLFSSFESPRVRDTKIRDLHNSLLRSASSLGNLYEPSDYTKVPKSGSFKFVQPFSQLAVTQRRNQRQSGNSLGESSRTMDETDDGQSGRDRRATDPTPNGGERGHWMRPCPNLNSELDEHATPASLSTSVLRAIHEANSQVETFINNFAREAFQVESWQDSLPEHSEFTLPFLNNSSGVDLTNPPEVTFPVALQEAYELMQRRAVGIEQVTLDQALYQANFLTEFRHVEDRIVHVLCELRYAMIQSGVTPKEDITKDVMEEEIRDMDSERRRNIRDAVILREYVKGLQDLHQLFNYFATPENE